MRKALMSVAIAAFAMTSAGTALAGGDKSAPTAQTKKMSAPKDDHTFAMHMAYHHRDGIAMADAVIANGSSEDVKTIARRIKADQQKDLVELEGHKGHTAHKHTKVPPKDADMERAMRELKSAKGAEADRLFLELMIAHHASAIVMTHSAMPKLTGSEIKSMAHDMFAKQAREIGELQRLRQSNQAAHK